MNKEEYLPDTSLSTLFEPRPTSFGLRGDPELWQELSRQGIASPIPTSPAVLLEELTALFESSTAEGRRYPGYEGKVLVERLQQGSGMSDGIVCIPWWINYGFPLLVSRHPWITNAESEAAEWALLNPKTVEEAIANAEEKRKLLGPPRSFLGSLLMPTAIGFSLGFICGLYAVFSN